MYVRVRTWLAAFLIVVLPPPSLLFTRIRIVAACERARDGCERRGVAAVVRLRSCSFTAAVVTHLALLTLRTTDSWR